MKIDWFTVIAQVLNFLILVWLLKRFLYKPVLKAIDEREKKITSQLEDAAAKETNAKKEQEEFRQKNETFDQEKKGLMDIAVAETKKEREKLLETVRNEAAELRSKLEKAFKEKQENLSHDIVQKTKQEVFSIARKTLSDIASISLEEQSANIFIKRLNELKEDDKKQFIEAFKSNSDLSADKQGPILVQSTFDLPEKQRAEITSTVNKILGTKTQFQFKTSPELISGIELTSNGYKLAWSISEYLDSLQKSISETMKKEKKEEPKKVAKEVSRKITKKTTKVKSEKVPKSKSKGVSRKK